MDRHQCPTLHEASYNGHKECVQSLIASGVEINEKDYNEWTPLHRASYNGHHECVKILLASGALIDNKDCAGWTPLHHASNQCHPECIKILLSRGARLNEKHSFGWTPLHFVSSNLYNENVEPAIVSESKIRERNSRQPECLRILLEADTEGSSDQQDESSILKETDDYGRTCLDIANDYAKGFIETWVRYKDGIKEPESS
jgi:ankyrin repeat protein